MKIDELSCDQFAGVLDKNIRFDKGLNLIVGQNESGKSTLIDLLYYLFFQDAVIDGRRDKEFKDRYFPRTTGQYQGDTIDGTVRFSGNSGSYKLTKEWSGKNGSSKLMLPDGTTIRDGQTIRRILQEELEYGRGIYDEFVFASQRRAQTVLQNLLGSKPSDAVKELAGTISKAVMETGGVDIDKMEAELDLLIKNYDGRWDFAADLPEGGKKRGLHNRWTNGAGSIVNAYYALEQVRELRDNAEMKERAFEMAADSLQKSKDSLKQQEEELQLFNEVRSRLEQKNNLNALLMNVEQELREIADAIRQWPDAEGKLKQARSLKTDLEHASKKQVYDLAADILRQKEERQKEADLVGTVDAEDIRNALRVFRAVENLESKLAGVSLTAKIQPYGSNSVYIRSFRTGIEEIADGIVDISEAVDITVPGVVDIQLVPKGVDVDTLQRDLEENRKELESILGRYHVDSVDALQDKKSTADAIQGELTLFTAKLQNILQSYDLDMLRAEVAAYPAELSALSEIEEKVRTLCGNGSIDALIGSLENMIRQYESRYGSVVELRERKTKAEEKEQELRKKLNEAADIPAEFSDIRDADQHATELQMRIDYLKADTERCLSFWSEAYKDLDEMSAEEYAETVRQKQLVFEEQKTVCRHWMHIRDVFQRLKSEMKGNPVADIEESFRKNLAVLSGNTITLEQISDKLESKIVSGRHPLSVEILSDGTKDTIALAFRLAVMEHLYPLGGAVVVFDDPFTDMDPERVREACGLVQRFADKNQVIFVTCDDKYCTLFDSNKNRIEI